MAEKIEGVNYILFGEIDKWDRRFLDLAYCVSTWSKDPSTQTGAVITDLKNRIMSTGYNGFAKGVKDSPERLSNREEKYPRVVHCEINAMIFSKQDLEGCTLYTYPFMSCAPCSGPVINSGISRVVAPYNNDVRWKDDWKKGMKISTESFLEAGLEVVLVEGYIPGFQKIDA